MSTEMRFYGSDFGPWAVAYRTVDPRRLPRWGMGWVGVRVGSTPKGVLLNVAARGVGGLVLGWYPRFLGRRSASGGAS
jgi:hypothetical protein